MLNPNATKEKILINNVKPGIPRILLKLLLLSLDTLDLLWGLALRSLDNDSGSRIKAITKFTREKNPAMYDGNACPDIPNNDLSARNPPNAGPIAKPKPNAEPIYPKYRPRFSGGVKSAIYAFAVVRDAEVKIPANILEAKIMARLVANPRTAKENPAPNRPSKITGRRPIRSDNRPQMGAKMN